MSGNNGDDKERRLRVRQAELRRSINRAIENVAGFRFQILRLVRRDVESLCPNHYEEVIPMMDAFDAWADYLLLCLKNQLRLAKEVDHDMPETQKGIYKIEDLRKSMTDMRLNYMLWFRKFEDIPSETERLELLMNLPSEAEVEAERLEAYRSGGASLLKNDVTKASPE